MRFKKRKAMFLIYIEGGAFLVLLIVLLINGISKKVSDSATSDNSEYTIRSFSDDDFSSLKKNSNEIAMFTDSTGISAASKADPISAKSDTATDFSMETEDTEHEQLSGEDNTPESTDPEPISLSDEVVSKLSEMTMEEKLAQMFIVTPETLTSTPSGVIIAGNITRAALQKYPVGGIAYSKVNYRDNEQAEKLISGANAIAFDRIGINILPFAVGADSMGESIVAIGRSFEPEAIVEIIAQTGDMSIFSNDKAFSIPEYPPKPLVTADNCVALASIYDESVTGNASLPCYFSDRAVQEVRRLSSKGTLVITSAMTGDSIPEDTSLSTAVITAINSGVDMVFVPVDFPTVYESVVSAMELKIISEDTIDQAAGRVLQFKQEMLSE